MTVSIVGLIFLSSFVCLPVRDFPLAESIFDFEVCLERPRCGEMKCHRGGERNRR